MSESKQMIKYARGTVWMCRNNGDYNFTGVQNGNRPGLIISNDVGNLTNKSVIVVFITSNTDKAKRDINIEFKNANGEDNVILCNQIKTVSKTDLLSYMGTLSDSLMKSVEEKIITCTGINKPEIDISVITNTVDNIIAKYQRNVQINQAQPDITQEQVVKIAKSLEELFCDVIVPIEKAKEAAPILKAFSESKDSSKANTEVSNTKCEKYKKHGRDFWTEDRQKEFMSDRQTMGLSELLNKWEINTPGAAYQLYYRFKSKSGGD